MPSELAPVSLGLLGALLLLVPGLRLRPDVLLCPEWPPLWVGGLLGGVYLLGLGLLCWAWVRAWRVSAEAPLWRVLLLGLPVHLLAVCSPPFLSQDTLFYAAVGRSLAAGGGPRTPVSDVLGALPAGEAFLRVLPPHWRGGTSAYGPGWGLLAWGIGRVAGDELWLHLRLHQAAGLLAAFGTAALSGLCAGPRAAALVWFCPLLIIEGSQGAHNDVLLALSTAAFALCIRRGRPGLGAVALGAGLLVKASALLLLGLQGARAVLARLPRRALLGAALAMAVAGVGALWALRRTSLLVAALGSPGGAFEYCTRSVECLPRVLLRYVAGAPRAAWLVGLAFRGLGVLWLLRCAARPLAAGEDRGAALLRDAATFLFIYYLYLHGWSQSWYLLPLLPLLPHADPRLRPAMLALCASALAYYALALPLNCVSSDLAIALTDLAEALVVIVPPSALLLRARAIPRREASDVR